MKQFFLLTFSFLLISSLAFSQKVATVNTSGSTKIRPGETNYVTVSVKNTQKLAIIKHKTEYTVTMVYKGSGTAGRAFNKEMDLGDPLDPGKTRNFKIQFTGPVLPGEYDVEVFLKWGNETVSNVDKVSFVVAENYEATLTLKTASISVNRSAVRDFDLKFGVTNSGSTAWPEGKYSLQFDVVSTPGGAGKYDKDAFAISPKQIERWDFEPGESDEYVYEDFRPPLADGSYVVKVTLLLDGKPFDAEGASKNFTFKVAVR
jgi:hypothetical protein